MTERDLPHLRSQRNNDKDTQAIAQLIQEQGFSPSSAWIIGDSVKSDINPGIGAGAKCILYLYTHDEYQWIQEYGVKPVGPFYLATTLHEVRRILESPGDFTPVTAI